MLLDNLKEVASNIFERIKNPFGGTLIGIWLIINWKLAFIIFNFDASQNLHERILIIQNYLFAAGRKDLIWLPLFFTFVALISYLFFQHVSLTIFTFFQKWGRPFVFTIVDRNKIVDKKSYDDLKVSIKKAQKDYDEVSTELLKKNEENSDIRNQRDDLQGKLANLRVEYDDYRNKRMIFRDVFSKDHGWWSKNYWGQLGSDRVCVIENGTMVFNIVNQKELRNTPREKGTGAYVNILGGIFSGETYLISARVSADPDSTLKFKLWVHDSIGGLSSNTTPELISESEKTISIQPIANETNAFRLHLHIEEGMGKLYVHEVRVSQK